MIHLLIQQDTPTFTPTFTDLIPVEQMLKNFRSCFKVLEYGIPYQTTSKMPCPLIKPFVRVRQNAI